MAHTLTFLIADDHPAMVEYLARWVKKSFTNAVVREADTSTQAEKLIDAHTFDVIMLDHSFKDGLKGPALGLQAKNKNPGTRVIYYTGQEQPALLFYLMCTKPHGILLKTSPREELCTALKNIISEDKEWLDSRITKMLEEPDWQHISSFSREEFAVACMVADGNPNKDIREGLKRLYGIIRQGRGVENIIASLYAKLNLTEKASGMKGPNQRAMLVSRLRDLGFSEELNPFARLLPA